MRHLCEQVHRTGPLQNYSAFGFDSANNFLIRGVLRAEKSPELFVQNFLRKRAVFSICTADMDESWKKRKLKHLMNAEGFVRLWDAREGMGRNQHANRTIYSSLLYTKLNRNISNCLVSTKYNQFGRIVFLKVEHKIMAVMESFQSCHLLSRTDPDWDSRAQLLFKLQGLGDFSTIPVSDIHCKYVLLPFQESAFLASLMNEAFENNWWT